MRPDLAALVGSRICHDLISPIGAISNGVELLAMTDNAPSAEMQLISDSVDNASARIRFFRIAFGSTAVDQMVSQGEIAAILSAMARGGRFTYAWEVTEEPRRLEVRIAFLLFQCFETALPFGGDIAVSSVGSGWQFEATGRKVNADPALWSNIGMARASSAVSPAQVHFALLPDALKEANRTIQAEVFDDKILVKI